MTNRINIKNTLIFHKLWDTSVISLFKIIKGTVYLLKQRSLTPGLRPGAGPWPKPDQAAETDPPPPHSPPHSCFALACACQHQRERSPTPSCMCPSTCAKEQAGMWAPPPLHTCAQELTRAPVRVRGGVPCLPQRLNRFVVPKRLETTVLKDTMTLGIFEDSSLLQYYTWKIYTWIADVGNLIYKKLVGR